MLLKTAWQNSMVPPLAQTGPVPPVQVWNMPPLLLPPLPPLPPGPGGVTPPLPLPTFPHAFAQERCSHELMFKTHCWQLDEMLFAHPW
jgi:hypothetical protein